LSKKRLRSWLLWFGACGMFFIFSISVIFFVVCPPVWQLQSGVTVTQWTKTKGEVQAFVQRGQGDWLSRPEISRHLVHAVMVAEDDRFIEHQGIDWIEVVASYKLNQKRGSYVRGASTITQQVVKMTFLDRKKTMWRKMREAFGALVLEKILSKDEIMDWYLNLAEFGDGIYGIKQASLHYFAMPASMLRVSESIHLALVLPSPNRWSKGLRDQELTDFGHKRFFQILKKMKHKGFVTENEYNETLMFGNFGFPILHKDQAPSTENNEMELEDFDDQ
jgi:monofunctional glycosyltransferase